MMAKSLSAIGYLSPNDHESKYLPPVPPERIVLVIAKMLSQLLI
jgi:hypothetical protein